MRSLHSIAQPKLSITQAQLDKITYLHSCIGHWQLAQTLARQDMDNAAGRVNAAEYTLQSLRAQVQSCLAEIAMLSQTDKQHGDKTSA